MRELGKIESKLWFSGVGFSSCLCAFSTKSKFLVSENLLARDLATEQCVAISQDKCLFLIG